MAARGKRILCQWREPGSGRGEGFGEADPVAPNDGPQNKARNRPVELSLEPARLARRKAACQQIGHPPGKPGGIGGKLTFLHPREIKEGCGRLCDPLLVR